MIRKKVAKLEDSLVEVIEPTLEEYKKSLHKSWKSEANINFRNFVAHDIAKQILSLIFADDQTPELLSDDEIISAYVDAKVLDKIIAYNYLPEGHSITKATADKMIKGGGKTKWMKVKGYEEGQDLILRNDNMTDILHQAKGEGIKEVVEWISNQDVITPGMERRWQAKLKEWEVVNV